MDNNLKEWNKYYPEEENSPFTTPLSSPMTQSRHFQKEETITIFIFHRKLNVGNDYYYFWDCSDYYYYFSGGHCKSNGFVSSGASTNQRKPRKVKLFNFCFPINFFQTPSRVDRMWCNVITFKLNCCPIKIARMSCWMTGNGVIYRPLPPSGWFIS